MAKYHINSKGVATVCRASKKPCPFGSADQHFDSKESANNFIDFSNEIDYNKTVEKVNILELSDNELLLYSKKCKEAYDKIKEDEPDHDKRPYKFMLGLKETEMNCNNEFVRRTRYEKWEKEYGSGYNPYTSENYKPNWSNRW